MKRVQMNIPRLASYINVPTVRESWNFNVQKKKKNDLMSLSAKTYLHGFSPREKAGKRCGALQR